MINRTSSAQSHKVGRDLHLLGFFELFAFVSFILLNETGPPIVNFPVHFLLIVVLFVLSFFAFLSERKNFFNGWGSEPVVFFVAFLVINIISIFFSERPLLALIQVVSYCILFFFASVLIQHHNFDSLLNLAKWGVVLIILASVLLHWAGF
jgi:hypothetical protein